jgi:hypothetical protein
MACRFEGAEAGGTAAETEAGAGDAGGTPAAAGSAPAEAEAAQRQVDDCCTDAERSAIYHKAREGFLDACHRATMFLVILSSSAAVATAAPEGGTAARALLLAPAILGALDMTLAFGVRAREHAILARRFLELAAECTAPDADGTALRAAFYRLCSEEPPTYRALDALAHNQVCDALRQPGEKLRVGACARCLRHLVRFSSREFRATAGG